MREEWLKKLNDEFQSQTWEQITVLMKNAYYLANMDTEYNNEYTKLVLDNLKIISNKEPMEITFKQWKSFRAYVKPTITEINKEKLFG